MSSPAIQMTFTLRTSANVKSVHLVGSWDSYKSQLPLSISKDPDAKTGSWKGTFRFQGSHALKLGSRYWYYYIVDGYHVSHDPAKEFTTEKTTGRKLNILDIPAGKTSSSATTKKAAPPAINTKASSTRHAREIPQGRPISPCKIACPKPSKPYASRQLREADYENNPIDAMDDLAEQFSLSSLRKGQMPTSYNSSDVSDSSSSSGRSFSSVSASTSDTSDSGSDSSDDNDSETESEDERPSRHAPRQARQSPKVVMQQKKLAQMSTRQAATSTGRHR